MGDSIDGAESLDKSEVVEGLSSEPEKRQDKREILGAGYIEDGFYRRVSVLGKEVRLDLLVTDNSNVVKSFSKHYFKDLGEGRIEWTCETGASDRIDVAVVDRPYLYTEMPDEIREALEMVRTDRQYSGVGQIGQ